MLDHIKNCFFILPMMSLLLFNADAQDFTENRILLDENCVVSVLNRTARVQPDGTWEIQNLPSNIGLVRVRASCVFNGKTLNAQSGLFAVQPNGVVEVFGEFRFDDVAAVVATLNVKASKNPLIEVDDTTRLSVTGTFSDGSTKDLTSSSKGTSYMSTNPLTARVDGEGLVTAVASGNIMVGVLNEGALSSINISVVLSGDNDGDGIPDDFEEVNGLNPNDPVDALKDPDKDGLNNLGEFSNGTDLQNADTDGDTLSDGQELNETNTNPLLDDTDGDQILDGLEVQVGSDPNVFDNDLSKVLLSIEVKPDNFVLAPNAIIPGDAIQELKVTGFLLDGNTIDVTEHTSTSYTSSDLTIANFGTLPGEVFAGSPGVAIITVSNSGFSDTANATVKSFDPVAISFVDIPGFANNVHVVGDTAFVASGTRGLQVVDVSDRSNPSLVGELDTSGNANDVKVVGDFAYIADGVSGLQIFDVSVPNVPMLAGVIDTPGTAYDVSVVGNRAYVADGVSGLHIIDISDPTNPQIVGSVDTPGTAYGVDVMGSIAVIADNNAVRTVDLSDEKAPVLLGSVSTSSVIDLVVNGEFAYATDSGNSRRGLVVVDISDMSSPKITKTIGDNILKDIEFFGRFAFGADIFRVNAVPIFDIENIEDPLFRFLVDFSPRLAENSGKGFRDDNGTGIASDSNFIYMTAARSIVTKVGSSGNTRLYIGQYLNRVDNGGVPPTVTITSPVGGEKVTAGDIIMIKVDATDDVFVASVNFMVNGEVLFTDTSEPYSFNFRVPDSGVPIVISVEGIDLNNNIGKSQDVMVDVLPGPQF